LILSCTAFLLIPDSGYLFDSLSNFRDNVSTHFPLGYLTDFIGIMSTTTTSSLPVINATIPDGVIGSGAHIDLDLSHSLDFILYATSSFSGSGASTTATFYDITSYYWNIICYIALAFYLLSRIVGIWLIPTVGSMSEKEKQNGVDVYKDYLNKNK